MCGHINNVLCDDIGDNFMLSQNEKRNSIELYAQFEDSTRFKQALCASVILNNFVVKIKASDKKIFIATYDYRGCSWRVPSLLCYDGYSFKVRNLDGRHLCIDVNMVENIQATIKL